MYPCHGRHPGAERDTAEAEGQAPDTRQSMSLEKGHFGVAEKTVGRTLAPLVDL